MTPQLAKSLDRKPKAKSGGSPRPSEKPTVVWGEEVEHGDFLKVPRVLLRIHRYRDGLKWLKPRHLMLLLVLASRQYRNKPIRVYWEELADDLGVDRDTVRKWAYELEKRQLLRMKRIRGRDPNNNKVGIRNDRNIFDLSPFVKLVGEAFSEKQRQRKLSRRKDDNE